MLDNLKQMPQLGRHKVTQDLKKDIKWWLKYMPEFNGTATIWHNDYQDYDELLATDACPAGGGALSLGEFFHIEFSPSWTDLNIACLELGTIMVAIKTWAPKYRGRKIKIRCDNIASVQCINLGTSSIAFMQKCLGEIALVSAMHDFQLHVKYIASKSNKIPDVFSRWTQGESLKKQFREIAKGMNLKETNVHKKCFTFNNEW